MLKLSTAQTDANKSIQVEPNESYWNSRNSSHSSFSKLILNSLGEKAQHYFFFVLYQIYIAPTLSIPMPTIRTQYFNYEILVFCHNTVGRYIVQTFRNRVEESEEMKARDRRRERGGEGGVVR